MSKVDAQRAMREARYAAMQAQVPAARRTAPARSTGNPIEPPTETSTRTTAKQGTAKQATSTPDPVRTKATRGARASEAATADAVQSGPVEAEALCGHRSIGNKRCQRPAGHPEQNHRYK